jgi:hypothetical protein
MRKYAMFALAAIAVAFAATPATAAILTPGPGPGSSVLLFGGIPPFVDTALPAVVTVASSVGQIGTPTGLVTATLTTEVLREAGGTLDFAYQVTNTSSLAEVIHRVTTINFAGWTTDVGFTSTPPNADFVVPTNTLMTGADRGVGGATIGWQITPNLSSNGLAPGETSLILYIRTNATEYTTGSTFAIDGGIVSFDSFAPTAVPEPSSMAIAGLGALGLIGYGIRRRRGA